MSESGTPLHPAQRWFLAEDLVRRRRSDEQRRYCAPQRSARIDANPHQVEAVIFALARLREGGCILADEVGLGKTIEAGLVIAQLQAEGARRILLLAPKPLLGQWRQELFQLFAIPTKEGKAGPGGLTGEGVFLIGREAAGSERGREALFSSEPFDLVVIDEAHELFSGLYRRFDKHGIYQDDAPAARTAGRIFEALGASGAPVLLLTATPIQNNLTELWALVKYVDPLGTLLGDLPTFREVFCSGDDRLLAPGQEAELRDRLKVVLQRTLRRQAQGFLEKPFVNREARLFYYEMSPRERSLYDDVTKYLLEPELQAFQGSQRQLLLLGYHRRLASSPRALAASLSRVARRLRGMLSGARNEEEDVADLREVLDDLEEDGTAKGDFDSGDDEPAAAPAQRKVNPEAVRLELERVEGFARRARELGTEDGKFLALLRALNFVKERAAQGQGAGKLVVFTESRVTQEYLRERLIESRMVTEDEVTLFNGANESKRAQEALGRWRREAPQDEGTKPSPDIATRLALVHEFKTRSRVFISTEAGAKGLNLQFCNALVNYDLPWNPQRIEQRIGRCHRYGQQHDVSVINFLAKDNEAQALTFEILSRKLELFGTVLDASDQVLHRAGEGGGALVSALGAEFETELRRVYERARTLDEVTAELRALRDRVDAERKRYEETHQRTANLIEERLDEGVQRSLKLRRETVPPALAELDRDLRAAVLAYLAANHIAYALSPLAGAELLTVGPSPALPAELQGGVTAAIGPSKEHASLHLGHPLVTAAVAHARATQQPLAARVLLGANAPAELRACAGKRGRLRVAKLSFDGFEQEELLVPVAVFEDESVLAPEQAALLLRAGLSEIAPFGSNVAEALLADVVDEQLFSLQATVDAAEQVRFSRASLQAENYVEDRLVVLKARRRGLQERLEQAEQKRDAAVGAEARTEAERALLSLQTSADEVDGAIEKLEQRDDKVFKSYRDHIQKRRYAPPRVQKLFDLDVIVEAAPAEERGAK
jgi:adenine-specific DNA-methyltransferase